MDVSEKEINEQCLTILNEIEFLRLHILEKHCASNHDLTFAASAFLCAGYLCTLLLFDDSHELTFKFLTERLAEISKEIAAKGIDYNENVTKH